jgi:alkylhydroperoxidase/carboxymuconolactone decarboxylase family protein YurZ
MIGDHHGGSAGRATLLIRAVDAILGTYSVSKDEIVELFIHLEAYAGAARAFDSYQIALEVFAENSNE